MPGGILSVFNGAVRYSAVAIAGRDCPRIALDEPARNPGQRGVCPTPPAVSPAEILRIYGKFPQGQGSNWARARTSELFRRLPAAGHRQLRGGAGLSAGEEKSRHFPLSFHFDFAATLEGIFVFEVFVGGRGNLDGSQLAQRLHAAGDVHGVAPEVVDEFFASDDPGDDRPAADADAKLELPTIAGVHARHNFL